MALKSQFLFGLKSIKHPNFRAFKHSAMEHAFCQLRNCEVCSHFFALPIKLLLFVCRHTYAILVLCYCDLSALCRTLSCITELHRVLQLALEQFLLLTCEGSSSMHIEKQIVPFFSVTASTETAQDVCPLKNSLPFASYKYSKPPCQQSIMPVRYLFFYSEFVATFSLAKYFK